jgi:hypothetical protein
MYAGPFQDRRPFYTVFGEPGSVSDGADGESSGFVEHIKGAFVARSNGGENNPRLAFETCNRDETK